MFFPFDCFMIKQQNNLSELEKRKAPAYRRMDSSEKLTLFLRAMPMLPKHSLWSASTEINVNSPTDKPLGADRGVVEFMRSEFRK
jgi:hypothetical protein